ncbi:hypothetical protein [Cellulomonas alba]|uniref:Carboxypeptidase regulatory-like domain-containing protein n=1 Tax=Cellulomonas alba TaxID=3053467 RepID=A0ABT7SEB5_9CELL|nr:hypothetical protein [Cellulomonas alba]MDM7854530.1 hypothetical protein [Cellulomonas alba]
MVGAGRRRRGAATTLAAAVALSAATVVAPPATADDPAWTIIAGTFLDDSGAPTGFVRDDTGGLVPSAWVGASEVSCTTGEPDPLGHFAFTDVGSDGRFVLRVVPGGCYDVSGSWRSVGQDPLPLRRVPAGTTALELRARAWSWSEVLDSQVAYQGRLGLQVQSGPLSGDTLPVVGGGSG